MSTIAVGDIHGESRALADLLAHIRPEMQSDDTLVFLGDYIDRGPDSRGCVEQILRFKSEALCPVVTLLGNHEQWMLRSLHDETRHSWLLGMEALDTIKSYSQDAAHQMLRALNEYGQRLIFERIALPYRPFFEAMPQQHLEFFQQLKLYHQEEGVICVHGGIGLNGALEPVDVDTCVWGPLGFPEDYSGVDAVVYGHRNNALMDENGSIKPRIGLNRTYGIDTISHGVLTALRLPDGKIFQGSKE